MSKENVWLVGDLNLDKSCWKDVKDGTNNASREEAFFIQHNDVVKKNDVTVFFGNIAVNDVAYWAARIGELPGGKILLLGDNDKNRTKWYQKFGFRMVIPFNESLVFHHDLIGKILMTHLPAFSSVGHSMDRKYVGLMGKHARTFENSSCIFNIHGHTLGSGIEDHRSFDVSSKEPNVIGLKQVISLKFR